MNKPKQFFKQTELYRNGSKNENSKYIINKELQIFECQSIEFKLSKSLHVQLICNYISGFLNASGGCLLIGIANNGIVKGISLSRDQIDDFQIELDRNLRNFVPTVFPDQITITFEKVFNNYNGLYYKVGQDIYKRLFYLLLLLLCSKFNRFRKLETDTL